MWLNPPMRAIAPPIPAECAFPADRAVWHLSLDQIESETGEVSAKRYGPASEAGTSTFCFDTGNVLYSKLRPYLNKVIVPDESGIATTELIPLRPNPEILDQRFLAYYLRSSAFVNQASHHVAGAKMPRVVMDWFWEHETPLPTPNEQIRIVELLDEADRLRRMSREASAKTKRILPALFLRMFGEPAMNPKGWDIKPLSKVFQSVEAGWSSQSDARPKNNGEMGVLKVSAVTSGIFLPEEHKAVPEVAPGRVLITPRRGDLLFSRANTRELVAATCIVDEDYPDLFLSDKLWRITPFLNLAKTTFLKELFWQSGIRDKFRAASSGSSGSMLNISQDAVMRTEVPIPPLPQQEKFDRFFWLVMDTTKQTARADIQVESTWRELLKRAFSGELTAKWREAHMNELVAEMAVQARHLNLPMPQEAAV